MYLILIINRISFDLSINQNNAQKTITCTVVHISVNAKPRKVTALIKIVNLVPSILAQLSSGHPDMKMLNDLEKRLSEMVNSGQFFSYETQVSCFIFILFNLKKFWNY